MLKIGIISATILALTLFSFSESLAFGESDRKYFRVTEDTHMNCVVRCDDYLEPSELVKGTEEYLEASYHRGENVYANFTFTDGHKYKKAFDVYKNANTAIFLNFTIKDMPSSDLWEEVKISKAELRFLALPFQTSDGKKGDYSGKVISSLFLCEKHDESKPSTRCTYGEEPFDVIIVNTEELPRFLAFDITRIFDQSKNSKSKELFFAIESKPIEVLKKTDVDPYQEFFKNNLEGILDSLIISESHSLLPEKYHLSSGDLISGNFDSDNLLLASNLILSDTKNTEEIISAIESSPNLTRKFDISRSYNLSLNYDQNPGQFEKILRPLPEISSQPLDEINYGWNANPSGLQLYFEIETFFSLSEFFLIPSSENESLSQPTIIVDYEILDSEFRKAVNYFAVVILPAIAIIIPAVLWIVKKKSKQIT